LIQITRNHQIILWLSNHRSNIWILQASIKIKAYFNDKFVASSSSDLLNGEARKENDNFVGNLK